MATIHRRNSSDSMSLRMDAYDATDFAVADSFVPSPRRRNSHDSVSLVLNSEQRANLAMADGFALPKAQVSSPMSIKPRGLRRKPLLNTTLSASLRKVPSRHLISGPGSESVTTAETNFEASESSHPFSTAGRHDLNLVTPVSLVRHRKPSPLSLEQAPVSPMTFRPGEAFGDRSPVSALSASPELTRPPRTYDATAPRIARANATEEHAMSGYREVVRRGPQGRARYVYGNDDESQVASFHNVSLVDDNGNEQSASHSAMHERELPTTVLPDYRDDSWASSGDTLVTSAKSKRFWKRAADLWRPSRRRNADIEMGKFHGPGPYHDRRNQGLGNGRLSSKPAALNLQNVSDGWYVIKSKPDGTRDLESLLPPRSRNRQLIAFLVLLTLSISAMIMGIVAIAWIDNAQTRET